MNKEYDFSDAKQGALSPLPSTKKRITIRLDADVVEHFKQQAENIGGGNYQSLLNEALKDHIKGKDMADVVRSAVHDAVLEMKHAA
ncbi:MAG: BrnA antitoxin family protein [Mariprofundaceae bacterium]